MELVRGGPRQVVTVQGDTPSNISGTGTVIGSASAVTIDLTPLMASIPLFVVRFNLVRTAGAGQARGWVRLIGYQGDVTAADNALAASFFGGYEIAEGTIRSIVHRFTPSVLTGISSITTTFSRVVIDVRGAGSEATTAWAITDISTQMIYTPL